MPQSAVLAVFLLYIGALLWRDVRRREGVSGHIWVVVCWVALVGSRPVSTWFSTAYDGLESVAQVYDEGNPIERMTYFVLMLYAFAVLVSRRVSLGTFVRTNVWLCVFFGYWALSILWADAPVVALKRWIKDLGNIAMVLVVLTESDPIASSKAVFVRCAAVLAPMSVLFIRFYSDLGRTYHVASGEMMYTGVTTHKNSLGMLVLVTGIFLLWDTVSRMRERTESIGVFGWAFDGSLLAMAAILLVQSGSATALVCGAIGAACLLLLKVRWLRRRIRGVLLVLLCLIVLGWAVDSTFDVSGFIIQDVLGRDRTLTTRTDVWPMLIALNENPIIGTGFNSFWAGQRLDVIYGQLAIFQAHNGYLETYLNGGYLGVVLLGFVLLAAIHAVNRDVVEDEPFADIRFALLWVMVIGNLTEASFNKMSILWFAFLLGIVRYVPVRSADAVPLWQPEAQDRGPLEQGLRQPQPNTKR